MDHAALAERLGPDRLCIYATGEASAEKSSFATKKARVVQALVSQNDAALRSFLTALPGAAA